MAEVTEGFSALKFWKNVEKKNISINFQAHERPQPKKLNFHLLKPPPAPEEEASTSVLVKSEWDDQNVTGAFDFWKKKAVEIKEEEEKYQARRASRNTVDLTNILAKSASEQSIVSASASSGNLNSLGTSGDSTVNPSAELPQPDENGSAQSVVGQRSPNINTFRRSRSISCENIPIITGATTTTTTTTSTTAATTTTAEDNKNVEDEESESSEEEDSDMTSEESEESDEEETTSPETSTPPPSSPTITTSSDGETPITIVTPQSIDNVQQPAQSQPQQIINKTATTAAATTPTNTPPSPQQQQSHLLQTRPSKDKKDGKRSIGATLTRTMTKTFNVGKDGKEKSSTTAPVTTISPPAQPNKKDGKVKLDKQEKERLKQEKRELKKKEREQKKQQKKKNLHKSLSLTEIKQVKSDSSQDLNSVFKVRLSKLVASNDGNLPPFITAAITGLGNLDNTDVSFVFLDAHNDPNVKTLRLKADKEPIDFSTITSPRIIGGLLRLFFSELPQPLFNTKFYDDLLEIHEISKVNVKLNDLRALIWTMSHLRRNLLQLFATFLVQKYINTSGTKQATIGILANTFGPVFIRPEDPKQMTNNVAVREDLFKLILENVDMLFDDKQQSDLIYQNVEGKLMVEEGTIDALIGRAVDLYYHHSDTYYSLVFFITHSYFINDSDLVEKLITLYKDTTNSEQSSSKGKNRNSRQANKISEAVKLWVDYCYRELREDKKLSQKILKGFPHLEAALGSRLTQSRFALSDILRVPKFHNRARSTSFSDTMLLSSSNKDPTLLAMEVAEQATIVDYELFSNIRISDWVRLAQTGTSPTASESILASCPILANSLKKSSTWCQWAMGEILQTPPNELSQRVQVINLLVEVAIYCKELCNYNTCIGILNAFQNHHVKRLEKTWEAVSKDTKGKIERLNSSLSLWLNGGSTNAKGEAQFNLICQSLTGPSIPHFATFRTMLQQIDQSIPTKSEGGSRINVDKLRQIFALVVEIQRIQQKPYNLKPTKLSLQLQDLQAPTMEELAELSLVCEPPVSKAKKYSAPVEVDMKVDWKDDILKPFAKPIVQTSVGIDLPRLACFFIVNGQSTNTNQGKIYDVQNVINHLSKLVLGEEVALERALDQKMTEFIPLTTATDSDIKRELLKFLDEVVGASSDSAVINQLLKCSNQATIAPAVIELTLNIANGIKFMDASGAWRIEINKNDNGGYTVRHYKRQKSRSEAPKDQFEFEWSLTLNLDSTCQTITSFEIHIISILFTIETSSTLKDQIKQILSPYLLNPNCIFESTPTQSPPTPSNNNNNEQQQQEQQQVNTNNNQNNNDNNNNSNNNDSNNI